MSKIEKFECGCERFVILDEEGDYVYIEWLKWCDKHKKYFKR